MSGNAGYVRYPLQDLHVLLEPGFCRRSSFRSLRTSVLSPSRSPASTSAWRTRLPYRRLRQVEVPGHLADRAVARAARGKCRPEDPIEPTAPTPAERYRWLVVGTELVFVVEEAPEGGYVARALGEAIFTEADDLVGLREMVRDAVVCHFEEAERPRVIRLHLVRDELLAV